MEHKDMFGIPLEKGDRILIKIKFPYCDEVWRKARVKKLGQNGGMPTVILENVEYLPKDNTEKVHPTYRFCDGIVNLK